MSSPLDNGRSVAGKGASLSTPGLLAVMGGVTLLYCYRAFGWQASISGTLGHVTVVGGGVLITLWGLNEILLSLFAGRHGRRSRHAAKPSLRRRLRILLGLALMAGGMGIGYLVAIRAQLVLTVVLAISAGVLLFVIGLRSFIEGLQPSRRASDARTRQRLPISGVFYLAIMSVFLVGSLIGRSNMLMLMFALMAGPFILNGWITRRMLMLVSVQRTLPSRVMAGRPIDVVVALRNGRALLSSWLIDAEDTIRGRDEALQTGVLFVRIPPREQRTASYRLRLMQRGRYTFGPLLLSTRFPLGVAERGLELDRPDEIIVQPRLGRLTDEWRRDVSAATELVQRERPETGIYDDEFHRLREFRWGDNPRAIHWRTSARRDELMVREYHQSRDRDLCVLLDLWQPEKPGDSDRDRVELAVAFAATLCVEHMRQSREAVVTLSAAGRGLERWQGQAAAASFDSLLDMLALIEGGASIGAGELRRRAGVSGTAGVQTILITTHVGRLEQGGNGGSTAGPVSEAGSREPLPASHLPEAMTVVADPETLSRYLELDGPADTIHSVEFTPHDTTSRVG